MKIKKIDFNLERMKTLDNESAQRSN